MYRILDNTMYNFHFRWKQKRDENRPDEEKKKEFKYEADSVPRTTQNKHVDDQTTTQSKHTDSQV